jgi:hypothetical protein
MLVVWGSQDDHLHGLCSYTNTKQKPVTIRGVEVENGDFYPNVTLRVADKKDGQWETLESSKRSAPPSTMIVKPGGSPNKTFKVDLDPFTSRIGKFHFGRITLDTGESATFPLDDLAPPEKDATGSRVDRNDSDVSKTSPQARPTRWAKTIDADRGHSEGGRGRFTLATVSQEDFSLLGDFSFEMDLSEGNEPPIVVEGYQAEKGAFWANAELQILEQGTGKWLAVGSAKNGANSILKISIYPGMTVYGLRVKLDCLKPLLEKHTLGRAVLKTGETAVFQLDDLTAPSEKVVK